MKFLRMILILVAVGVLLSIANSHLPMDGAVQGILNLAVFAVVVVWLLQSCGMIGPIRGFRPGRKP